MSLISLGVIAVLGASTLGALLPDTPRLWQWSMGWLTMQGLISLSAGALVVFGAPLSWALLAPGVALALAILFAGRRSHRVGTVTPRDVAPRDVVDPLLRSLAILLGMWALFSAWTTLDLGWDGMAIWGLKGRTLAETGAFPLHDPLARSSHPEYPLHLPLLAAALAHFSGAWSDNLLPLLAACDLTALAMLLTVAFEGRGGDDRRPFPWQSLALFTGLTVPFLWQELTVGKADINVACCLAGALVGLERWLRLRRIGDLRLAALAVGLAAWSKQEGLVYVVIFIVLAWFTTCRGERHRVPWACCLALLVALPWHGARFLLDLPTEPFGVAGSGFLDVLSSRLPIILSTLAATMTRLDRWGVLGWLTLAALLWCLPTALRPWRRRSRAEAGADVPIFFLLAGLAFIVTAYVTTPYDLAWHLRTSLDRLLLQLLPAAVLVIHRALLDVTFFRD